MANEIDPKEEIVSFKELLMSEVIQSDALINFPNKKGIVSKLKQSFICFKLLIIKIFMQKDYCFRRCSIRFFL